MSHVLIYKEGDSCLIRGIKCDMKRVCFFEAEKLKASGWVSSVYDLYGVKDEENKAESTIEEASVSISQVFKEDPKKLTKDELKDYGETFGLKLSKRMLEDNMISAIQNAIEVQS